VDIDASPAQLPVQVPECQEIVSAIQDMNRLGQVGDGLDYIQLIEELPPGSDFCQMLRFVDHHCSRPAKPEGLLDTISVFASGWVRPRRRSHDDTRLEILLVLD
jgi:hypothetical protein